MALSENVKRLVHFCKEKGFSREDTLALGLLCKHDEAAKEFLEVCGDYTDFFDCLEEAVKINDKYDDENEEYEDEAY